MSNEQKQRAWGRLLRRGVDGVCSRMTCECESRGLGDECIWLRPAEPVQEPVAWKDKFYESLHHQDFGNSIPLYAAPQQRLPLTDEEIDSMWRQSTSEEGFTTAQFVRNFARAIEQKHGIGGKT